MSCWIFAQTIPQFCQNLFEPCPNIAQILPELDALAKVWGHSPPPPSHTPMPLKQLRVSCVTDRQLKCCHKPLSIAFINIKDNEYEKIEYINKINCQSLSIVYIF